LLLALIVAPLAEEFVFRGYLYGVVRKWGGRGCAIGTTSLLFAAIHLHLPSMAALFFLGVVLALIYELTRRLWIPCVLHAIFNGISAGVVLFWPEFVY
jgi:membrane protease YdiL (CAAX protease family)